MLRTIEKCSENCDGGKNKYSVQFHKEEPPEEFEIDEKYELSKVIWYTVCAAIDKTTGETVAIKKIRNVIFSESEGQRALRELQIIRELRHPFIVKVKDVMLPSDKYNFNEIFVVSEIMQQTLNDYLEKIAEDEKGPKKVSNFNIKLIMNQLLRGVQYMHASGVLHLDIKPDNILMDGLRVKLCDFGHSRQKANQMTRYVGTTNYLPPEFFLNPEKHNYKYGESADVWALGCVLSDILHPDQGFLLDLKSYSGEEDNLHKIAEIIRVPEYVEELYYFIDDAGMVLFALEKLPKTPKEPLTEKFKDVEDKLAIDLLEKMLNFNPNKRITIEEALKHEYMADITVEVLAKELNLDSSEVEQLENLSPSKSGEDDDYGSATEDDDCGSAEEDGDCRNTEEDGDCRNTEENDDCGSAEEDDDCGSAEEDELRDKLYDLCLSFKTGDN